MIQPQKNSDDQNVYSFWYFLQDSKTTQTITLTEITTPLRGRLSLKGLKAIHWKHKDVTCPLRLYIRQALQEYSVNSH